jgi:ABC-type transport system involved in Fe-S cluster assembly fused permease/ATPase subunit
MLLHQAQVRPFNPYFNPYFNLLLLIIIGQMPWHEVSVYAVLSLIGSTSLLGNLENYLWIPIQQYSYDAISTAAYSHIMNLSSDFHNSKQSGEVYKAVDQGLTITTILEMVIFRIIPNLIDLGLLFGYFYFVFDAYLALIVATVTILYLFSATRFHSTIGGLRRVYRDHVRAEYSVRHEGISSWQTASVS